MIYIENKNKTNLNELDAIILNSRIDRTGSFSNDDKVKESFRIICPEKNKLEIKERSWNKVVLV